MALKRLLPTDYCLELLEIAQNHGLNRLQTACIEEAKKMKFKDLKNHNMYEKISSSNFRKIVEGMFEIYERELAGKEPPSFIFAPAKPLWLTSN